ncbi:phosphoribosylanthranilate isomerase [Balneatrix alpica]|uniref:phosphoribosylanthranilate isomerase n=1 Tax=Balneatrix alpica TaxID=75684 RepID=UPI002739D736|nr:phosphoribosylanthranilate isomerase [Balneatrix alpica]
MRTRVKICGICRIEDAQAAIAAGADALGWVFYPPSKRAVSLEQAAAMTASLPPFVERVGLFVDDERQRVEQIIQRVSLSLLQFHGDESPEYCESFALPYIKAIRMRPGVNLAAEAQRYQSARALLVDTYQPGVPGGTGQVFDWQSLPAQFSKPLILAGGLTASNVAQAIMQVRPYAVDVSGGVEAQPGQKDASLISAFMQEVGRGDAS